MEYRISEWKPLKDTDKQFRIWYRKDSYGNMSRRFEYKIPQCKNRLEKWIPCSKKQFPKDATIFHMRSERDVAVDMMENALRIVIDNSRFLEECSYNLRILVEKSQKALEMLDRSR